MVRISTKLALGLTLTSTLILGIYGLRELGQEERDLRAAKESEMRVLGTSVQVAVENALRDKQLADVREILDTLRLRDVDVDVLIFDPEGRVTSQSVGSEPAVALIRRTLPHVGRIERVQLEYAGSDEEAHLVGAFPMRDDDAHALGVVVLVRSLEALRRDLHAESISTVVSIASLACGISALSWILVLAYVRRPIQRLGSAMRAVRGGDLNAAVPVTHRDELGELAGEFNAMLLDLEAARRERDDEAERRHTLEAGLQRVDKLVTVGQLSAGLAHEIGSPLQILSGRAEALAERVDLPMDARRVARILVEQSERISRIMQLLLGFARRKAADIGKLDIRPSVRAVVDLMDGDARRRGIRLDFECPAGLPHILADGDQVQQVALNLLSNAIRATSPGGRVRIEVRTAALRSAVGAESPAVELAVEDYGLGMSDAVRERLFEPFFSTSSDSGGTGLGLAVVKSIVDDHGGTISVSSKLGHGSRFAVCFPIAGPAWTKDEAQ